MQSDHLNYRRLVGSSLVGALIGLVFDFAVTFLTRTGNTFAYRQIPSYLAFGIVGFAGGWLFELFKVQAEVTDDAVRAVDAMSHSVERLTRRIGFADQALGMLTDAPRHAEVLSALIKASLADNFRNIPYVGVPTYLRLLGIAVSHAESYEGIHRFPFRWYADTQAGQYLGALRDKEMRVKTRVLIIDDADLPAMCEDLDNHAVMDYYWQHTGAVATYWMTVGEFHRAFPGRKVPDDLALYDRQLWVAYDEVTQTLNFDVVGNDAAECQLFDDLQEMISRSAPELKSVERAGDSRLRLPS
jgi:hypothetical protein